MPEEKDKLKEDVTAAVAQAWQTKENKHKEMDADLAGAIVNNVINLIKKQPKMYSMMPNNEVWGKTYNSHSHLYRAYLVGVEEI